jgi:hypothetical protein
MHFWFPELTNEEPKKKHLTEIIFESTKYIKILKESLIHNATSSKHHLAPDSLIP